VTGLEELAAVVFGITEPLVPVTQPQPFRAYMVLARGRVPAQLAGQAIAASWTTRWCVRLVWWRATQSSPRWASLCWVLPAPRWTD
jgi:hypothetical protein